MTKRYAKRKVQKKKKEWDLFDDSNDNDAETDFRSTIKALKVEKGAKREQNSPKIPKEAGIAGNNFYFFLN